MIFGLVACILTLLIIHHSIIVLENHPPVTLTLIVYIEIIHILLTSIILHIRVLLLTVITDILSNP